MWRRILSTTSASARHHFVRSSNNTNTNTNTITNLTINRFLLTSSTSNVSNPFQTTAPLFSQQSASASASASVGKLRVEDVMPIATGHEKEELVASLQGRDLLEMNHPAGPFGTKEAPAIVQSVYDKRIVGCPGGEGEDEHDVVWFWLEKGKTHECPVCTQHFKVRGF
ncbi:hypothetical protein AQUCO_00100786v1 [Aquilegia coerulea]|uniref:Uncharacterized protein n=1 Tax=Aquilegia coerulea TaxID=218851 RepID=A0A2G5FBX3_AQUCA|nr:hypothetical protein AQUCO_00100786v1 [Aquilegia coerulea]